MRDTVVAVVAACAAAAAACGSCRLNCSNITIINIGQNGDVAMLLPALNNLACSLAFRLPAVVTVSLFSVVRGSCCCRRSLIDRNIAVRGVALFSALFGPLV